MSEFMGRIRSAGRAPTGEERLLDIVELHGARPGITEATLGAWTTAEGKTGYDLLVEHVPPDATSVLELGAGNGPLLAALKRARPRLSRLVGVDLCRADLDLARARLGDAVELRHERADAPSLGDASMDVVLTHHAFYLFDPPEPVIRNVARVLRPGGLFATAHWTFARGREPLFEQLLAASAPLTQRDAPHFSGWGDPRMFERTALEALLAEGGLAGRVGVEEHTLTIAEPADVVCERLMGFFYTVELQRPDTQRELRDRWLTLLRGSVGSDGLAHLRFPFSIVTARLLDRDRPL